MTASASVPTYRRFAGNWDVCLRSLFSRANLLFLHWYSRRLFSFRDVSAERVCVESLLRSRSVSPESPSEYYEAERRRERGRWLAKRVKVIDLWSSILRPQTAAFLRFCLRNFESFRCGISNSFIFLHFCARFNWLRQLGNVSNLSLFPSLWIICLNYANSIKRHYAECIK